MKNIIYLFLAILLTSCTQKQEIAPKSPDDIREELNAYAREKGLNFSEFNMKEDPNQQQVIPSEKEIQEVKMFIDTLASFKKSMERPTEEESTSILNELNIAVEEENQELYDELVKKHDIQGMRKGDDDYPFKDIKRFKTGPKVEGEKF